MLTASASWDTINCARPGRAFLKIPASHAPSCENILMLISPFLKLSIDLSRATSDLQTLGSQEPGREDEDAEFYEDMGPTDPWRLRCSRVWTFSRGFAA